MKFNLTLVKAFIAAFVFSAGAIFGKSQQFFSGPIQPVYTPSDYLGHLIDPAAKLLLDSQPVLDFNGYWTNDGAVITSGNTGGSIAWNATVNVGVGSTQMAFTFSYELDLVSLSSGEAMLVLKYTETVSNGTGNSGLIELRRIRQSNPNQTFPADSGGGGTGHTLAPPSGSPGSGPNSGFWMPINIPFEYGYYHNGVYYVVAGSIAGQIWISTVNAIGAGDNYDR